MLPGGTQMDDQTQAEFINSLKTEKSFPEFVSAMSSFIRSQNEDAENRFREPLNTKINTFAGQDATIPNYILKLIEDIGRLKVHYLTDRRAAIGKAEAERLLSLKTRRGGSEELQNIRDTVSALLGVKIDAFQGDSPATGANAGQSGAELDVDDFLVEANGSGVREAIRLILDIEFNHPDIVLVEEPEMHLHPGLETSMMQYLKRTSKQTQVFITTHSTNFLDTSDMRNVYLVAKPDATAVARVDFEEAETQIPRELGLKLSSLFMFDRLAFVEGPTDEGILREWASKIGINLSQTNVGFVPIGGGRNFLYFATEATLRFLSKRNVSMWFVLDRDERDAIEADKIQASLGDRAKVVLLNRREMENYLICPKAIAKFIKWKLHARGGKDASSVNINDKVVEEALDKAADELKELAVQKRVAKVLNRPVYPRFEASSEAGDSIVIEQIGGEIGKIVARLEELKSKAGDILRDERIQIQASWPGKKLEIVPGDELLDAVCQKFGVRFHKDRDGVRLASLLNPEDIPEEIREILRELGRMISVN
jgi:putative ATP-dependent endonuclease of the OLD family